MKKFLVVLTLLGTIFSVNAEIVTVPIPGAPGLSVTVGTGVNALPLQQIKNNPSAVNITQGDDDYRNVPLGFDFPMYGQKFNNSWAMTNGMVTFKDPAISGIGGACCSGVDLRNTTSTQYNYSIFGVHTDLYSSGNNNQYYLRGNNEMTYGWYGVSQCCDSNGGNSFEIKINSQGVIDTRIAGAMVGYNTVTSGFSGDLSKGEYYQYYHGNGLNITSANQAISWGAMGGTGNGAIDMCLTNPLSSPSCPGYTVAQCTISALYNPSCPGYAAAILSQQCASNPLASVECPGYASAYLNYQCSLNPLYSTTCQGYEQAYQTQQCSLNPLYSTTCSGYQQAYQDQQCSINPLYSSNCTGYATAYLNQQCSLNPLYSTTCSGYSSAYFNQQCSLNSLYSTTCPNYAVAYKAQQCSINPLYATDCPGYAIAYKTQQCSINPLYATDCPGYDAAYKNQQCSINPLYATDCIGYQLAYFTQQCNLDGLYDRKCSNYDEAYAKKNILNTTTVVTETSIAQTTTTSTTAPSVDSSGEIKIALVADSNVNDVITSTATSASPAQAATATVPLVPTPPPPTTVAVESKQEEKNASSNSVSSTTTSSSSSSSDSKPSAPTARQELQARRQEAARAKAVEAGKNLGDSMGKAADMEAQKQIQNVVIQAMGYTPGFDVYQVRMPDVAGYKPFTVYNNQKTIDNRANLRMFGGTDKLHQDMVDSQYNKDK